MRTVWLSTLCALVVTGQLVASELEMLPIGDPERALAVASAPAGGFYDCRQGREASLAEVAASLARARVILLGEEHTSMDQKLVLAQLVEALAGQVPKLILGMEFFQRSDAETLAKWGRGELAGDEFLLAVKWYDRGGYRYEYYAPMMEMAQRHHLGVVGLNVPREVTSAVRMGGLEALSEEQKTEVGPVETGGSPEHRYLISRYFGDTVGQMPGAWLENMYAAQCVWDVVMARSILDNLDDDATMVVVVGAGHVAYDLGIARRIREEREARGLPPLAVATYCPVVAPAVSSDEEPSGHPMGDAKMTPQSRALFSRGLADFVGAFPDAGGVETFPRLGVKIEESDDVPTIRMVWPDTVAEDAGFTAGDKIVDVNGQGAGDLPHLRLVLARLEWGQRVDLRVRRGEETRDVAALLYPEVHDTETTTAPGWEVRTVDPGEPQPGAPVTAAEGSSVVERRLLLLQGGVPQRVEVWSGESVVEVHELDPQAHVSRSLFRSPRPDGTVEVRYHRGEAGEVTGVERLDRTGKVLD